MRITASVDDLIARLEAHKRRELAAYELAAEKYPRDLAAYRKRVERSLARELAGVRAGRRLPSSMSTYRGSGHVNGVLVSVGIQPPAKPHRPHFADIDRRIKELRLSSRDELSIDTAGKDWRGMFGAIAREAR